MSRHYKIKECQKIICMIAVFLLIIFLTSSASGRSILELNKDGMAFPKYGTGKIDVYIHTDYFCVPCRAAEPNLEPTLENLVNKGIITVTFVDTPTNASTPVYVRYFFYALKENNNFAQALLVRRVLFEAAGKKIIDEEKLKAYLKQKGIAFTTYDIKPLFARLNDLLNKNKIRSTPSCVIEINGKPETFIGGEAILNALNALK